MNEEESNQKDEYLNPPIQTTLISDHKSEEQNIRAYNFRKLCSEIPSTTYLTHGIHYFPAKFIPQIPRYFIKKYTKEKEWVFDPFAGAGTTLVEAKLLERNSTGVEINPLGRLMTKVKTTPLDVKKLKKESQELLERIKNSSVPAPSTQFPNIDHWFNADVLKDLRKIKQQIKEVNAKEIRDFFRITFSSIIKEVSNADPDIPAPLITKKMRRKLEKGRKIDTIQTFEETLKENVQTMEDFSKKCKKKDTVTSKIIGKDARNFPETQKYDLIVTSPPYINAHEYIRIHKLQMYWLDLIDHAEKMKLQKRLVGSMKVSKSKYKDCHQFGLPELDSVIENVYHKDEKRAYVIYQFFVEMNEILQKIFRVLKKDGHFALIVGDNTIRHVHVPTHKFLRKIAQENGYSLTRIGYDRIKSRALMTKRNVTNEVISKEWVLVFQKEHH